MTAMGWTVAVLGALIIATRGPLIFAPAATLAFYRRLLGSVAGIRAVGVALIGVGMALVATSDGAGGAERFVTTLGWVITSVAILFLIIAPNLFRSLAEYALDLISDVARPLGVVAVAVGLALVWLGVAVL